MQTLKQIKKTDANSLKLSVSFGNKKLPKGTMIFNIPAVSTCPLRTTFCEISCYALKAEVQYKNVVPQARARNLKISKTDDFINRMSETIQKNTRKIKQIRIHESGDFYSQEYLDKWFTIARAFPDIQFYAYTKSFHLDFTGKALNFVLIASFDKTTDDLRKNFYESKAEYFDNTFTIIDAKAKASCIADCTKCSLCWNSKGNDITVNAH